MKSASPELPLATAGKPGEASIVHAGQEPSVGQLLQAVIEKGDPEKNIAVLERLIALKERSEAKEAERQFAAAFIALQSETQPIAAVDMVPDKQGNARYYFASYQHIMEQVHPLLQKHGFGVTFDTEVKENRMVIRCTLLHTGGHSKTTTQFMKVSAPYGASEAQADGATVTMGKRYALCSALNIVIDRDTDGNDARNEGEPITHDQAQTLRELVRETRSNETAFLKYAGAATYEEIGSKRYQELFRTLQNKLRPV